jgi:hypothetical protein
MQTPANPSRIFFSILQISLKVFKLHYFNLMRR